MIKRSLKMLLALILLTAALLGALIPIIPGWPFALAAIAMTSPKRKKKLIGWLKKKLKK